MTKRSTPSEDDERDERWRRLSAFVDGELSAREAAETAQRIADDPAAARQAAQLAAAKEALGEAIPAPALTVPTTSPRREARARRRRWATGLGAAAAALLLAAGLTLFPPSPETQRPAWAAAAEAQHAALSDLPGPAEGRGPRIERATLAGFAPFVPTLEAARLDIIARLGFEGPDGAPGLAVHYRGARGCRVTLVALRDGADDVAEALTRLPQAQGYVWRVGGVRYQLLARGMDRRRFAAVAEAAHQASRLNQPAPDDVRRRLAQARADSAPCQV